MRRSAILHDARRDAGHALRQLGRRPGFASAALLTLALGIGAPTAIFSIVRAVLLEPLPFPDAGRLVGFRMDATSPRGPIAFEALPVAAALEWGAASTTLESLAVYSEAARTLSTADGPVRLTGVAATPNLFEVLGTRPAAGNVFAAADGDLGQVVVSHRTWQEEFGGEMSAVGSVVMLDGVPHRITGVMPAGFDFPAPQTAFWVPVSLTPGGSRGMLLPAIGRLRPAAAPAAAAAEGLRHLAAEGGPGERFSLVVRPLRDMMVGDAGRTLWVLMAAVSLVSLLATANIAFLLLTRGASRSREFSVRLALGAARGRLVRQVCVEGFVLAVLGGIAGLGVAAVAGRLLVQIAPPDLPRLHDAAFDAVVLLFSAGLVLAASVIFGIFSAGRVVTGDALRALGSASADAHFMAAGVSRGRLNLLAAGELALAMVLLVGAGLLLRSFVGLVLLDQGFDSRNRIAMQVTLPSARYPAPAARMDFHDRLLTRLRQGRGVTAVAITTSMPNRQPTGRFAFDPSGVDPLADPWTRPLTEVRMVSEGFFAAMGVPLLEGREFTAADVEGSEPVIVISRAFASVHFPKGDAVGRMLYSQSGDRRVIGVVGDVRPASATALQSDPSSYLPLRQSLDVFRQFASMHIVVLAGAPEAVVPQARAIVRDLDPELPLFNVRTLDDEVAELSAGPRFIATVLGLFALVALAMAAVGVYGVMAYAAARRTREVGIRVALGATRSQVLGLMMRDGCVVVAAGLATGALAALWLTRSLTGLLHDVRPADPLSLAAVAGTLLVTGLAAAGLPAWRATRVTPLDALREE